MIREAIILAGGLGTRLQSVVNELPKSMAPINEKPFLSYQLDYLIHKGINSFILSVGYKAEDIENYFKENYRGAKITYVYETKPLGTGGAIKNAIQITENENIIVANGDTLFLADIDLQTEFHLENFADVTLALKPMQDFNRYGSVDISSTNRIFGFKEKKFIKEGLINGGIYIFNKSIFDKFPLGNVFSIEKDFFELYVDELHLYGFIDDGYFLDIGIPEDYQKAQIEFKNLTY
jgi:D-glycero-alpha-D-manno-heptose 1-phosphate guanylyltransferase